MGGHIVPSPIPSSLLHGAASGSLDAHSQAVQINQLLMLLQSERDSVISSLGQRSSNVGSITGGLLGSPRPNAVAEEPSTCMAESTASTASRPWEEESMSASATTTPEPSAMGPEPSLKEVIEAR